MSTLALEIHDAGIRTLAGDGAPSLPIPGYAVVDGGALAVGWDAFHRARLQPRFVHHRFWERLDTEPLGRPFPSELTHADLAHAHLKAVWDGVADEDGEVVLVLPGTFSDPQLGLVLGMARACGMPVLGMVDLAVAAAAAAAPATRQILHLDLHLHRLVLTEVEREGGLVQRGVDTGDGAGAVALQEAWVRRIAGLFVHATRFDPLHSAATEQSVYSSLGDVVEHLRGEESAELVLEAAGREYTVEVERGELIAAAGPIYDRAAELVRAARGAGDATLLLADGLAGLPGLAAHLAPEAAAVVPLAAGTAAAGALAARDAIAAGDDDVTFILRLPATGEPSPQAAPGTALSAPGRPREERGSESERKTPTHVLYQGLAHPISGEPLLLGAALPDGERGLELAGGEAAGVLASHLVLYRHDGRAVVDRGARDTFLNGTRVAGRRTLSSGDRLRLGDSPGLEVELIAVVEPDGTA